LEKLSKGSEALFEVYDGALTRIEQQREGFRQLARKVLTWIVYTRRELSIQEVQEAIAIKPGMIDLDHENNLNDENEMVSIYAGLVTVDNKSQVIRLVHYTI
jgi:hypothetical protein